MCGRDTSPEKPALGVSYIGRVLGGGFLRRILLELFALAPSVLAARSLFYSKIYTLTCIKLSCAVNVRRV